MTDPMKTQLLAATKPLEQPDGSPTSPDTSPQHKNQGVESGTGFRTICVGSKTQAEKFVPNIVKTSIYTVYSFLPKNLFKQFTRFSNVYFLFITALQLIPEVTSTPGFPTMVVPLVFIMVVSALRDLVEDLDRHQSDAYQNRAPISKLDLDAQSNENSDSATTFQAGICADLHVGELVRVQQNEEIPADIVLLAASRGQGQCYVMTANLDGESTLKPRYVPPELCTTPYGEDCFTKDGELTQAGTNRIKQLQIECEPPNRRIDRFEGSIKLPTVGSAGKSGDTVDLDITHILLKGTQLKDTPWVVGVVVYTGNDTRVRQNSSDTPIKQSWLYRFINKITLWVVLAQIVILTIAVVIEKNLVTSRSVVENPYIDEEIKNVDTLDLVYLFLAYMLLFSNFVPISLQVTIDVTRYFQAIVIQRDPEMRISSGQLTARSHTSPSPSTGRVNAPDKPTKQTAVRVQSSELNEELGLVEHVFTDKTGTLTCNRMAFRSCHLDGKTYNFDEDRGSLDVVVEDFVVGSPNSRSASNSPEHMKSSGGNLPESSTASLDDRQTSNASRLSPQATNFLLNLAANNSISPSTASTLSTRKSYKSLLPLAPRLSIMAASPVITTASPTEGYSGPSPDEKALVAAAARLGVKLLRRDNAHLTISMNDREVELQILHLFEFTSDRKKSSIVCRHPDGKVMLYCKGADTVILRALSDKNHPGRLHQAKEQMQAYSANGLRVLCIAERELSEDEYTAWNDRFVKLRAELKKKAKSRGSRVGIESEQADAMSAIVSELESELTLVGISAIEDKIQDGAPETLEKFREAGIKVWMLTGDRPDTATNVAYAVRLISSDMRLIKLTDLQWLESKTTAIQFFERELKQVHSDSQMLTSSFLVPKPVMERLSGGGNAKAVQAKENRGLRHAVILNDTAVEAIRRFGLEQEFLQLCMYCESVLCARISPKQKEFMVEMVRTRYPQKVTMAIGDGANDVPMIQRAHIGVGIAGEEGNQASDASDYSLPAFRFLQKLVLVHGRSMNRRISVLTLYIFYKNVLLVLPQFVYGIYCLFSGQSSYYDPLLQLFNICFTSLPVLYFSVFDQDISASISLQYPRLYQDGSLHSFLNMKLFVCWMFEATVASILIILVPAKLIPLVPWSGSGKDNDLWSLGLTQNFIVVFLANARLLLEVSSNYRTMLSLASASVLFWWVVVYVMSSAVSFGREFFGILLVGSLTQLALCCVLCTGLSLFVAIVPRVYDILFAPKPRTICRELDYITDAKDREYIMKRRSTAFTVEGDSRAVVVPT